MHICSVCFLRQLLTIFPTTNFSVEQRLHLPALLLDGRMDIAAQRGGDVRMPENLRERFDVKARGDPAGGEGMAQRVEGVSGKAVPASENVLSPSCHLFFLRFF